jgi:hypothetical protein
MINEIKDYLIVKDNFFSKEVHNKILMDLSKLKFANRSKIDSIGKAKDNPYQKIYFSVQLTPDYFVVKEIFNFLHNNFKFKLKSKEHAYFLSTKHQEMTPHIDELADLNCLIYLKGEEIVNSGTGFFEKQENGAVVLNRHIGFKENRAIIFDPKIYHTSLQYNKDAKMRYVMANFFTYEDK